jgi:myo-inositol-1(or 4)-monophosphatase
MSEVSEFRAAAGELARGAGAILKDRLARERTVSIKGGNANDLVTDADQASEAYLLEGLGRRFPGHAVLAEESGASGEGTYLWLVDPLDGTVNYAHRLPHFCVSIALEGPVAGGGRALLAAAVCEPLRGELFTAARGEGASLDGQPIRVSGAASLAASLLCTGFPYAFQAGPERYLGLFNLLAPRARGVRRLGSAALELAWLAAGRLDAYFEYGLKPWDTAAGALLVQEAGGVMTRLDGQPYEPRWPDVLAATPAVAPELLRLCQGYLAAAPPTQGG